MSEAVEQVNAVLDRMGAPGALAPRLLAALGPGAAADLDANPWLLLRLPQVSVEQADFCARRRLGDAARPDDPRRLAALTAHVLRLAARRGNTVVEEKRLAAAVGKLGVAAPAAALEAAAADGSAVVLESTDEPDEDFDFEEGGVPELPEDTDRYYALADVGGAEQRLGEELLRLISGNDPIMDTATAGETVEAAEERGGFSVSDRTREAVVTAALRPVTVLSHGPGDAGEIARALLCLHAIAAESRVGIAVAAPTAQAAAALDAEIARVRGTDGGPGDGPARDASGEGDRAAAPAPAGDPGGGSGPAEGEGTEGSGAPEEAEEDAGDGGDGEEGTPEGGEDAGDGPAAPAPLRAVPLAALTAGAPLTVGLVVLCEAMSVGAARAAELAAACPDGAHLVLVADPRQAPSAAPGRVALDIAASRTAHVAEIAGAEAPGPLAELAAAVAAGGVPEVEAPGREVVRVPASSAEEAAHRVVQLVTDSIPRALGIGAEDVQVVAAREDGPAGTRSLNAGCKERLNPGPGAHGGFDVGDRVLLAASGPGFAPGDTGYLREVDGEAVVELTGGARVRIADPAALRHGWAVTVAAAHGGLWPAVVAVFPPEVPVSRPQVYTALTRATRHVSVVDATAGALETGVRDNAALERSTLLVRILREG
ncbi:helix-hairpin-helix domain-containing protein [Nocardiopsis tropica]|uniref:Helix-hairpin-helix domain-containing protein n=3 Tax=Nocardiopsis tropica TaxID=109330 RepID=A0ABU7KUJ4_9ACTN|nr:helix-hairpin-helix domain-containing protein [Nocardiopsis umidischolae]MEE2052981.1 helix-hairpin-helix domain-containing protein [Nocardiopsis umidischolae]